MTLKNEHIVCIETYEWTRLRTVILLIIKLHCGHTGQ